MINLIPNEEKKRMVKDFYLRFVTMFFVMLSVSVLIASALILPSYFFSLIGKETIDTKLKLQENEAIPAPDQNTLMIIKDLEKKLSLIENNAKDKYIFSTKVINEITLKKIPNIKITEISYQNSLQTGKKISISGRASSREILLAFRRALEDNAAFSKVNLPISNFVKGSNIRFYLTLIPS